MGGLLRVKRDLCAVRLHAEGFSRGSADHVNWLFNLAWLVSGHGVDPREPLARSGDNVRRR